MRLNNEETFICGKFCACLDIVGLVLQDKRWFLRYVSLASHGQSHSGAFYNVGGPFLSVDNAGLLPLMLWSTSEMHCGLDNRRG